MSTLQGSISKNRNFRGINRPSFLSPIYSTFSVFTASGRLIFNIFASLAEFEKDLIRERTKSGLEAARARGRKGGRSRGLSKEEAEKTAMLAQTLYSERKLGVNDIAKELSIYKMTMYKYLRHRGVTIHSKI